MNELAIQESAHGKLKRAIWLPEGTSSTNPEHSRFIEALHHPRCRQVSGQRT